jgi:hypothetical protein
MPNESVPAAMAQETHEWGTDKDHDFKLLPVKVSTNIKLVSTINTIIAISL